MNEFLWQTYHRLVNDVSLSYQRFLYYQWDLNSRLTGLIGPRGTGKTTLLLQYIKKNLYDTDTAFYFSADNIYFNEVSIIAFVDELYQKRNITHFFIDEIHKYPTWDQTLKNIYDSFPKVKVVFSGSSSIDLIHGSYDLSRRAKLYYLPGLSFREYLNIKTRNTFSAIKLDDLIQNHQQLAADLSQITTVTKHFEEYVAFGYYPFIFEGRDSLYETIASIIDKTVYEDIANYYQLKTSNLNHFKTIISFLASIPPGEFRTNNVASRIGIDNKTIDHYVDILNKTGMVKKLFPIAHGNQILSRAAKIYLDNTTLLSAANNILSGKLNIGTERELAFFQSTKGAKLPIYYPSNGDFQINDIIFEIGGKNKTAQQLKATKNKKIIVKDNLLIGFKNEIPLYLFGFLY